MSVSGRFLIIANPKSSNYSAPRLASVASQLRRFGVVVAIAEATSSREICALARSSEAQSVIVAGGDGSINAAIEGLLCRHPPRPVLGIIPMGLGNLLAHEVGLPSSALDLAALFHEGQTKRLCLGFANERPFVLMASAGLDAKIVHAVAESGLKRMLGRLAYAYKGLAALLRGVPDYVEVEADNRVIHCKIAIVTNGKYYGGKFEIAPDMSVLVPGFKLIAVKRLNWATLMSFLCMVFGRLHPSAFVEIVPATHVEIRSAGKVATQVDGDYRGTTPLIVRQCPDTIEVFCS